MALAVQSIAAGSTTAANGATVDAGSGARRGWTAVCTSTAGISAGAFELQVSADGTNWVTVGPATVAVSAKQAISVGGGYRYARAVISTTVTGGTVGITVANA